MRPLDVSPKIIDMVTDGQLQEELAKIELPLLGIRRSCQGSGTRRSPRLCIRPAAQVIDDAATSACAGDWGNDEMPVGAPIAATASWN